ncbi:hypothetical protein ACSBR2_011646 [Camellia fascicularis]
MDRMRPVYVTQKSSVTTPTGGGGGAPASPMRRHARSGSPGVAAGNLKRPHNAKAAAQRLAQVLSNQKGGGGDDDDEEDDLLYDRSPATSSASIGLAGGRSAVARRRPAVTNNPSSFLNNANVYISLQSSQSTCSLEQPLSARSTLAGHPNTGVKIPMVPPSVPIKLRPQASVISADAPPDTQRDKRLSLDMGSMNFRESGVQRSTSALQDALDMLQVENESLLEKVQICVTCLTTCWFKGSNNWMPHEYSHLASSFHSDEWSPSSSSTLFPFIGPYAYRFRSPMFSMADTLFLEQVNPIALDMTIGVGLFLHARGRSPFYRRIELEASSLRFKVHIIRLHLLHPLAALKVAAQTYGGRGADIQSLWTEAESAREEAASALEQLHDADIENKSLRIMTQRLILSQEEMEEVVLKRCWIARYWSLCVHHRILAEIATARHEHWSSFAPLPVEVVLAAGQKAKDENSLGQVEDAVAIAMAQHRRSSSAKSGLTDDLKLPIEGHNFSEAFGLANVFLEKAKIHGLEPDIAEERLQFWINHVECGLVELKKLGIETQLWEESRKLIDPNSKMPIHLTFDFGLISI